MGKLADFYPRRPRELAVEWTGLGGAGKLTTTQLIPTLVFEVFST
jgi:hypothetical protein